MTKQTIKALFVGATMLASSFAASANETFIVCNGTNFDLIGNYPAGTTYTQYEWFTLEGTTIGTTSLSDSANYTNITLNLTTATTAAKKQFVTHGYNDSCWSDYDTVTVYVLPSLTTNVVAQNTFGCDNGFEDTLTATTDLSGLDFSVMGGQGAIDIGAYSWSGGTGTAYETDKSVYVATSAGTYVATVGYDEGTLPVTINGETVTGKKVDCKSDAGAGVTIQTTTAPNRPTITIQ